MAIVDRDPWSEAIQNIDRDNLIRTKIGLIVNRRYKIVAKISFGSYGSIFVGDDITTPDQQVAVKFEMLPNNKNGGSGAAVSERKNEEMHLRYEYEVYKVVQGAEGIPHVHWYGIEYDHEIMAMDLLGPSLEHLFGFCNRTFSIETIVTLGEQMLRRIRHLHDRGFVHRDIKSENFLMGIGNNESRCYIIDFGLARRYRYRDGRTLRHIQFRRVKNLVGTAKYASLNSHFGNELSRRDDLESLGYILVEFLLHELPWKDKHSRNRTKEQTYRRIKNKKETTNWSEICAPIEPWIRYCRGLPFAAVPNYDYLFSLLRQLHSLAAPAVTVFPYSSNEQSSIDQQSSTTTSRLDNVDNGLAYSQLPSAAPSTFDNRGRRDDWNTTGWPTTSSSSSTPNAIGFCSDRREPLMQNVQRTNTNSGPPPQLDWIRQCDEEPDRRYSFQCQFRWTLPYGVEPQVPLDRQFGFGAFGFG